MQELRIIDANANRAREALRVLEETARFGLDDRSLTASLKTLRHDLVTCLRPIRGLELHRDVERDVGTSVTTETEGRRVSIYDVVRAAAKRLQEALRVIEEYGKLVNPHVAVGVETLRYRSYAIERELLRALPGARVEQWRVCVLLTEAACAPRPWEAVAEAVLAAGPDSVQLREPSLEDGALLARARFLVDRAGPETCVVVNDRPDVALLSGADGVHLGPGDLPCADVRRLAGDALLIGVSTSCLDEARRAATDGADYCGVGPMFPSSTKHKDRIAGPAYLREYVAWDGLPHLAIGGITPDNVGDLVAAGACGIAVSAAVCAAEDPAAVIEGLRAALAAARV